MNDILKVISPVDNSVYAERPFAGYSQINSTLTNSVKAQSLWEKTPLAERKKICSAAATALSKNQSTLAEELSWQMGRPIQYGAGEINGFAQRTECMIEIAERKLHLLRQPAIQGFDRYSRYIQRLPVGIVFSIVPWNYPYLTAVNVLIPAIMAGNSVIMKPSSQTPLTGERIIEAFTKAGLPDYVLQLLILNHDNTQNLIGSPEINYVSFTGSVNGGVMVEQAAAGRFIGVGLELGGKDPAYVRNDADVNFAIDNLADGVFFNSGQSCCGIERIYVHTDVYDDFVAGFIERANGYNLGNPLQTKTTLGPMVSTKAADRVRLHIQEAVSKGAVAMINQADFTNHQENGAYMAPQVLLEVNHSMLVMKEESFGPLVGIMKIDNDDQAIKLMNDSRFGLTASVWTADSDAAETIGKQVNTGTFFMNRCDYLDPQLAWTGIKQSGKGCTLSEIGYEALTRPKSFHLRK